MQHSLSSCEVLCHLGRKHSSITLMTELRILHGDQIETLFAAKMKRQSGLMVST